MGCYPLGYGHWIQTQMGQNSFEVPWCPQVCLKSCTANSVADFHFSSFSPWFSPWFLGKFGVPHSDTATDREPKRWTLDRSTTTGRCTAELLVSITGLRHHHFVAKRIVWAPYNRLVCSQKLTEFFLLWGASFCITSSATCCFTNHFRTEILFPRRHWSGSKGRDVLFNAQTVRSYDHRANIPTWTA
jgi:hypothetical protein